ncbi:MAG: hypothetical protein AB1715_04835 [Acidobacteriota bacterium]
MLLGFEIGGLAAFLWNAFFIESSLALGMAQPWSLAALVGLVFLVASGLIFLIRVYARFLAPRVKETEAWVRRFIILTLAPLLLLYLTFAQKFVYLRGIDGALLCASGLGFIFLQAVFLPRVKRNHLQETGEGLPLKRLSRRLFWTALLIYVVYVSGLVFPAQPFTGDEPHYLLIIRSLLSDGDLNLADDYRQREYAAFYDGDLDSHAHPGKKGEDFLYSKHFPALPVLILPFYAAGQSAGRFLASVTSEAVGKKGVLVFFSRLPICLLTSALGALFFLLVAELTRKKRVAVLSWLLFSFTAPILFYSHLIYPEIPVALILLGIFYQVILKKNISAGALFWAGAGISLLPWFGIKYLPLAAAAFALVFCSGLCAVRKNARKVILFFSPLVASAALFIFFLLSVWGTLSPLAAYSGTIIAKSEPLSTFLVGDMVDFLSRLVGLFWDQRVGLFIYAPFYVLGLAGLWRMLKIRPRETVLLAILFAVFWVFCSVTHYWAGFCPPGRPLLPVVWIPAVFISWALTVGPTKTALAIRYILMALSFIVVIVSLPNPRILYHEGLSMPSVAAQVDPSAHLLSGLDNLLFDGNKIIPVLSSPVPGQRTWRPLVFWLLIVAGIVGISVVPIKASAPARGSPSLILPIVLVFFLSLAILTLTFFHVRLENGFIAGDNAAELYPQDKNCFGEELEGFWVRGESRSRLVLKTAIPVREVSVSLRSPVEGKVSLRLGNLKRVTKHGGPAGNEQSVSFSSPRGFRWKGSYLYSLEVKEERGFYPYLIDKNSKDRRFLGVFLRLSLQPK